MKTNRKGFTIIELLVSVGIIAILTAIITANFATAKAKSRDAKRVSDIAQLQLALELYFDRCSQYPQLSTGSANNYLMSLSAANGCPSGISLASFISKLPTPPTAGDYRYAVNNYDPANLTTYAPTDYVLRATLEGQNQATLDDVDGTFTTPSGVVSSALYTFITNGSGNTNFSPPPTTHLVCDDTSSPYYYCAQPR